MQTPNCELNEPGSAKLVYCVKQVCECEPIQVHVHPLQKGREVSEYVSGALAFFHTTLQQALTSLSDFTADPKRLLSSLLESQVQARNIFIT